MRGTRRILLSSLSAALLSAYAVSAQSQGQGGGNLQLGNCVLEENENAGNNETRTNNGRKNCQVNSGNGPPNSDDLFDQDSINIDLGNGKSVSFQRKENNNAAAGDGRPGGNGNNRGNSPVWYGESGFDSFNLIQGSKRGVAAGSFLFDDVVYQMFTDEDGNLNVTGTPSNEFPPEEEIALPDGVIVDEPDEEDLRRNLRSGDGRELQEAVTLDILVLWTPKSECHLSNKSSGCTRNADTEARMQAMIELAVQETNVAYVESGAFAKLRLVHSTVTNYNERGFSSALEHLQRKGDGRLDDAHELRTIYGADIVALIISDSEYCGLGCKSRAKVLLLLF